MLGRSYIYLTGTPDQDGAGPGYVTDRMIGAGFSDGDEAIFASGGFDVFDGWGGSDLYAAGDGASLMIFHNEGPAAAFPVFVQKSDLAGFFIGFDVLANFEAYAGGPGADMLLLGPQDDTLDGGAGTDTINGGAGTDTLAFAGDAPGGVRVDLSRFAATDPWGFTDTVLFMENVIGTAWADTLAGDAGANLLDGGAGADVLSGGGGDDTLLGGEGNDVLADGEGADLLRGGAGDDVYAVSSLLSQVEEAAGGGQDTLFALVDGLLLADGVETGALLGGATLLRAHGAGAVLLANAALGSTLVGGAGADMLVGGALDDTLLGGAGADTLFGMGGADRLEGGAGDDLYRVSDAAAQVVEAADGGFDIVLAGADGVAMGAHVELGVLDGAARFLRGGDTGAALFANPLLGSTLEGGAGADVLVGGAFADTLLGGGGADVLFGMGGADVMEGGAGDDTYLPGDPSAAIVEAAGGGVDMAGFSAAGDWVLGAHVEFGLLSGEARVLRGNDTGASLVNFGTLAATLAGGAGDDSLLGGAAGGETLEGGGGRDVLNGMGGGDRMAGGAGDDTYVVTDARDVVAEAAGGGEDLAWVQADGWLAPEWVETAVLLGTARVMAGAAGRQVLGGNAALGSTLDGGAGDDVLLGTAFADVLRGGAGDDVLLAGGGADRLVLDAPGWGADAVHGLGAGFLLDFAGSGVAGRGEVALAAMDGFVLLETAQGSLALHGVGLAQVEAALLF